MYDVTYTINKDGLRIVNTPEKAKADQSVFLGDSLTFGEGLNDNDTLPSIYSSLTHRKSYNYGMSGFGPHNFLFHLENHPSVVRRWKENGVRRVYLQILPNHIKRVSGDAPWDRDRGPCFIAEGERAVYKGSFSACKTDEHEKWFKQLIFRNWRETNISLLLRTLDTSTYRSARVDRNQVGRFISVISSLKNILKESGIDLVIVLEDFTSTPQWTRTVCSGTSADWLANRLRKITRVVRASEGLNYKLCMEGKYEIAGDGHPTRLHNLAIANMLNRRLE